jgi:hypothetical protein
MQYIQNMTLFVVRPSSISGTRRLESTRASASRVKRLDQDIVNPKRLSDFNRISTSLFRVCRSYGTKLSILNAWSVENSLADELEGRVREYCDEWTEKVDDFIRNFRAYNLEWANERDEERLDILRLCYTEEELRREFRFAFARFCLKPEQIMAQAGLEEEINGLAGQALKEFADQIRDMGVKDPQNHVFTGAIHGVLGQIRRKAASLSFLDPVIGDIASTLEEVIRIVPSKGKVEGAPALLLRTVVDSLTKPADLMKFGLPKFGYQDSLIETDPAMRQLVLLPRDTKPSEVEVEPEFDPISLFGSPIVDDEAISEDLAPANTEETSWPGMSNSDPNPEETAVSNPVREKKLREDSMSW